MRKKTLLEIVPEIEVAPTRKRTTKEDIMLTLQRMIQSLLPCVIVHVREKIKAYSSSLEESSLSSLALFLGGSSSPAV